MCHRHTTSSKRQPSSKILPKSLPTYFSTPLSQDKQNCARNQHRKAPGSIHAQFCFRPFQPTPTAAPPTPFPGLSSKTDLHPKPAQEGSGQHTMRNSVSGHSSRPLPQRRLRRSPALAQDRFASEAHAGTLRAGFSPKVARVLCPGTRQVGKKSDRSLGRDSSLMRIVFRIGLLTRAVQTDNATKFLQNTFMVKCHRTPPIHEYAEKLSLSS